MREDGVLWSKNGWKRLLAKCAKDDYNYNWWEQNYYLIIERDRERRFIKLKRHKKNNDIQERHGKRCMLPKKVA